jgi:hypothetical protein
MKSHDQISRYLPTSSYRLRVNTASPPPWRLPSNREDDPCCIPAYTRASKNRKRQAHTHEGSSNSPTRLSRPHVGDWEICKHLCNLARKSSPKLSPSGRHDPCSRLPNHFASTALYTSCDAVCLCHPPTDIPLSLLTSLPCDLYHHD